MTHAPGISKSNFSWGSTYDPTSQGRMWHGCKITGNVSCVYMWYILPNMCMRVWLAFPTDNFARPAVDRPTLCEFQLPMNYGKCLNVHGWSEKAGHSVHYPGFFLPFIARTWLLREVWLLKYSRAPWEITYNAVTKAGDQMYKGEVFSDDVTLR